MYLNFYGLYREPFHITPDPEFLFESPCHKEAYATMVYGVEQRKGFIAVTGEVGTGKTTIVRSYLKGLNLDKYRPIYVFNPDMSFDELLRFLLNELGAESTERTEAGMIQWLHWRLIEFYKEQKSIILVIDEAQNMPVETLEKLRMLSNLETTEDKLLQILLVGQPELDDKLNLHQLRQLKQRVAARATLRPLNERQSIDYIEHRISRAGGRFDGIFSNGALRAIVRHAAGSPRTLNILCDNVLLAGFGAEQRPIAVSLVREVARDLDGRRRFQPMRWAAAAAAAAVIAAAGVGVAAWSGSARSAPEAAPALPVAHAASTGGASAAPAPPPSRPIAAALPAEDAVAPDDAPAPSPAPAIDGAATPPAAPAAEPEPAPAPAATAPVADGAVEAPAAVEPPAPTEAPAPAAPPAAAPAPAAPRERPATQAAALLAFSQERHSGTDSREPAAPPAAPAAPAAKPAPAPAAKPAPAPDDSSVPARAPAEEPVRVAAAAPKPAAPVAPIAPAAAVSAPAPAPAAPLTPAGGEPRRVLEGETLIGLIRETYGAWSEPIEAAVLRANPFISDRNMILTGQTLVFPTITGHDAPAAGASTSAPERGGL